MKSISPIQSSWRYSKSDGFTLLEVMVAVSILAIGLSILFVSQSGSLSIATEARFYTVAKMLAASKYAELEAEEIVEGSDEGDFGEEHPGYSWELNVERAQFNNLEDLDNLEPPLMKMELTIVWSGTNFTYPIIRYGRWEN